jgi:hypothetical protein
MKVQILRGLVYATIMLALTALSSVIALGAVIACDVSAVTGVLILVMSSMLLFVAEATLWQYLELA